MSHTDLFIVFILLKCLCFCCLWRKDFWKENSYFGLLGFLSLCRLIVNGKFIERTFLTFFCKVAIYLSESFPKAIYYTNFRCELKEWCQYRTYQDLKVSCMSIYFYKIYFLATLARQMTVEILFIIITAAHLIKDKFLIWYLLSLRNDML